MVGVGMLMLAMSWLGARQIRRRGLQAKWLARGLVAMTFSGWVATIAGWYVTKIGRQPYLVYGVLKTVDAASSVSAAMIASTFIMCMLVYVSLTIAYVSMLFFMAGRGVAAGGAEGAVLNVSPSSMEINPQLITRK